MASIVTTNSSAFIARFPVRSDKREEFLQIFDALWRGAEPFMNDQCNLVYYGWDRSDSWFYTIESYKDESALAGLRQSEQFQTVVGQLLALCRADMELQILRGMNCDAAIFNAYPAGPSKVHPTGGGNKVIIS